MKESRLSRFRVIEFTNPRTGTVSYRVTGTGRDGRQLRENFSHLAAAQARQAELEADYLGRRGPESLRFTSLTAEQAKIAEACFLRLDEDRDLVLALDHWLAKGRPRKGADGSTRLDDAVAAFEQWLEATGSLRQRSKGNLRTRVRVFAGQAGNLPLLSITPDSIDDYLGSRKLSAASRDNDRRALSRFFSWCIERPRRWLEHNPCREVRVERAEGGAPEILTLRQVMRLPDRCQGAQGRPARTLHCSGTVRRDPAL
jgi:hypothetical protein